MFNVVFSQGAGEFLPSYLGVLIRSNQPIRTINPDYLWFLVGINSIPFFWGIKAVGMPGSH